MDSGRLIAVSRLPLRWAAGTHFHLVKSSRPINADFTSAAANNRHPRPSEPPERRRQYHGVSVLDTPEHAAQWTKRFRDRRGRYLLGEYVAELHIPEDAPIIYEGQDEYGHGNLYNASPETLRGYIVRVIRIA